MAKIKKRIEIVYSAETENASIGRATRQSIFEALSKHYRHVDICLVNNLFDLQLLVERRPDLVFLSVRYVAGLTGDEPIAVKDYLDANLVSYNGSDHAAYELGIDKPLAKQRIISAGLQTPRYYELKQTDTDFQPTPDLPFPLFVKPTNRGNGFGVDQDSIVNNQTDLLAKTQSIATQLGSDSLIERYLPGREFSVAILRDELTNGWFVMPLELFAPVSGGQRILSKTVKYADTEHSTLVPNGRLKHQVSTLALDAFKALGARDYGRIDIRLDDAGTPHFLEANLGPGLKHNIGSYFPRACLLHLGLDYEQMILAITRLGLARPAKAVAVDQTLALSQAI